VPLGGLAIIRTMASFARIGVLCVIAALLSARPGSAVAADGAASRPPTTAPAIAVDPADLLRRMASDDWKQRQAAERELVRLGEDALPAINAMLNGDGAAAAGGAKLDAETRARLQGARRQIAEDGALGATYVTLHLKDAAPAEAVAALAKASRGPLRTYPDNLFEHGQWPRITLDLDRVPLWDAMRQLCDRLGLAPNGWNDGLRLMPNNGEGDGQFDGPSSSDGPFLIVANEVHHNRSVRLVAAAGAAPVAARAGEDDFGVQFSAFAEPKLTVLSCSETVVIDEAVDDHGNSLRPEDEAPPIEEPGVFVTNRGTVWDLQAPLRYPAKNPGTKIARLRGSVSFTIQSAAETIEIPDPLRATAVTTRVVSGVTIEIQPLRKEQTVGGGEGKGYELKLSLTGGATIPGLGRPDAAQLTVQRGLRLLDDKGRALHTRSFGSSSTDGRRTEYRLVYVAGRDEDGEPVGEPTKLFWEIPTGTKQRKAKFELKDLPMP
jgi:hypothetical protein